MGASPKSGPQARNPQPTVEVTDRLLCTCMTLLGPQSPLCSKLSLNALRQPCAGISRWGIRDRPSRSVRRHRNVVASAFPANSQASASYLSPCRAQHIAWISVRQLNRAVRTCVNGRRIMSPRALLSGVRLPTRPTLALRSTHGYNRSPKPERRSHGYKEHCGCCSDKPRNDSGCRWEHVCAARRARCR